MPLKKLIWRAVFTSQIRADARFFQGGGMQVKKQQQYAIIFKVCDKAIDTRSQTSLETSQRRGGVHCNPLNPLPGSSPADCSERIVRIV